MALNFDQVDRKNIDSVVDYRSRKDKQRNALCVDIMVVWLCSSKEYSAFPSSN